MDRNKALEQLESVRTESDLTDPQFAEAFAALEDDAAARQEFDRRLELDGRIAAAMLDVEAPVDLRDKLVAACETESPTPAKEQLASKPGWSRRRWVAVATSVAAAVVLGILLFPRTPTLTFDELVESAPRSKAAIDTLAKDAEAQVQAELFQIAEAPVWFDRHRKANLSVAWPTKSLPYQNQTDAISEVVAGPGWVLIATPKEHVTDIPNLKGMGSRIDGAYAYKAWQDENFVYVLVAKGNERTLDGIYRDVFPAATA